jgi:hypothetical protein
MVLIDAGGRGGARGSRAEGIGGAAGSGGGVVDSTGGAFGVVAGLARFLGETGAPSTPPLAEASSGLYRLTLPVPRVVLAFLGLRCSLSPASATTRRARTHGELVALKMSPTDSSDASESSPSSEAGMTIFLAAALRLGGMSVRTDSKWWPSPRAGSQAPGPGRRRVNISRS